MKRSMQPIACHSDKPTARNPRSEGGYVLVAALVTLLLLTVLGIWATRSTNFELRTVANERLRRQAFYQADSADALAERLIHHNMLCVNASYMRQWDENDPDKEIQVQGFSQTAMPYSLRFEEKGKSFEDNQNKVIFFDAKAIKSPGETGYDPEKDEPSDDNRTFLYCPGAKTANECEDERHPRTNVLIGSKMAAKKGQGLIQSSGYEGYGVGAANVGFYWTYKIRSQHLGGISGNESRVNIIWQLSGMNVSQARDEDCQYGEKSRRYAGD